MTESHKPKCPVCNAPRMQEFRPFCSKRCADQDLGRWFTGSYAIPSEELPGEFDIGMGQPDGDEDGF